MLLNYFFYILYGVIFTSHIYINYNYVRVLSLSIYIFYLYGNFVLGTWFK